MIVKNEAHVLGACLASARPLIDRWVIVDTGSTDNTMGVALEALKGVPGEFVSHEWKGFADARNRAQSLAVGKADYGLALDADETIEAPNGFGDLTADAYVVWARPNVHAQFITRRLLRLDLGWEFKGVLHEYQTAPRVWEDKMLEGVTIRTTQNGARSKNPAKYRDDAKVLERALLEEPNNSRYVYYLAQSLRDGGDFELAAARYLQRTGMGPGLNHEEIYCSWLEAGRCFGRLGRLDECEAALLKARQVSPARPEAVASLSLLYGIAAKHMPPTGTMNVETYHYKPEEQEAAE